ncbi:MAG: stage III sporulation protein AD [Dethiobacteria bacterium]|nr:stage III sporulation protein AD [Bacillota bacterium]HOB28339.1 stage III sporulation protein AD [Bacillota bacterium]
MERSVLKMEIVQVVGLGLVAALLVLILREYQPEMAMQVSLVTGVIIMFLVLNQIIGAVNVITETAVAAGINLVYLQTLLRVIGIAYLAEFGAQLCRDAGEGSIASRVELAAKVIILVMAVPVIVEIMESVLGMIPQ